MKTFLKKTLESLLLGLFRDESLDTFDVQNWEGTLRYQNLEVSEDFLGILDVNLGLPITIQRGIVKELTLNIPWRSLMNQACKLKASGFYLLLKIDITKIDSYTWNTYRNE